MAPARRGVDWRHHGPSLREAAEREAECRAAVDVARKTLDEATAVLPRSWIDEDPKQSEYVRLRRALGTIRYWLHERQLAFRGYKMPMNSFAHDQHDDRTAVESWNDAGHTVQRLGDELKDYVDHREVRAAASPEAAASAQADALCQAIAEYRRTEERLRAAKEGLAWQDGRWAPRRWFNDVHDIVARGELVTAHRELHEETPRDRRRRQLEAARRECIASRTRARDALRRRIATLTDAVTPAARALDVPPTDLILFAQTFELDRVDRAAALAEELATVLRARSATPQVITPTDVTGAAPAAGTGNVPPGHQPPKKKKTLPRRAECEIAVRNFLTAERDPTMTVKRVAAATGYSTGLLCKTSAWKAFQGARTESRQKSPDVKTVNLQGRLDGVAAPQSLEELIEEQEVDGRSTLLGRRSVLPRREAIGPTPPDGGTSIDLLPRRPSFMTSSLPFMNADRSKSPAF